MTNLRGPRPPWECRDSRGAPITAGCEVFWRPPKHSRFIRAFVRACDDDGALPIADIWHGWAKSQPVRDEMRRT